MCPDYKPSHYKMKLQDLGFLIQWNIIYNLCRLEWNGGHFDVWLSELQVHTYFEGPILWSAKSVLQMQHLGTHTNERIQQIVQNRCQRCLVNYNIFRYYKYIYFQCPLNKSFQLKRAVKCLCHMWNTMFCRYIDELNRTWISFNHFKWQYNHRTGFTKYNARTIL